MQYTPTIQNDVKNWITAAAKMIVAAVLLGAAFRAVANLAGISNQVTPAWLRAIPPVIVHVLLLALAFTCKLISLDTTFSAMNRRLGTSKQHQTLRWWVLIAGPGWFGLVGLAAISTSILIPGKAPYSYVPDVSWWLVSLAVAPLTEELVYRGLIARHFRAAHGYVAGTYLSAVLFAWVHTWPSLQGLISGQSGNVPPGPLLLALVCDWLYVRTGSLWPAIAFHAACNATPALFLRLDPRWLDWFGALYQ
jgi:membrane protease YdiL (CAAX protease family)